MVREAPFFFDHRTGREQPHATMISENMKRERTNSCFHRGRETRKHANRGYRRNYSRMSKVFARRTQLIEIAIKYAERAENIASLAVEGKMGISISHILSPGRCFEEQPEIECLMLGGKRTRLW